MVIHPRSLENLRKPKKPRKYGYRYALPQEKVDELFGLLTDNVPLREAAKKIEICYDTAKKYFDKGDDRRGIKPLKFRLQVFQDTVSKEFDKELIERREHLLKIVVKAIGQLEKKVEEGLLEKKSTYHQLVSLIRVEMWLRGGETVRRETRLLTAEDVRDLAAGKGEGS